MSRSVFLNSYPMRLLEIADAFQEDKTIVKTFKFPTQKDARNFRFDVYGYQRALRKADYEMRTAHSEFLAVRAYVRQADGGWLVELKHGDAMAAAWEEV